MPTSLAAFVAGLPVDPPHSRTPGPLPVYSPAVAYADNASVSASTRPRRIGTLPDPAVGGFSENVDESNGFTVDPGYSPHARADFLGQGHYDLVQTQQLAVIGAGTPNVRLKGLRAGALAQLSGGARDDSATAMQFAAALSGYQAGLGTVR